MLETKVEVLEKAKNNPGLGPSRLAELFTCITQIAFIFKNKDSILELYEANTSW